MNIEQAVLEKLRQLPLDKQQELLDFVEFLYQKMTPKSPLRSVRGLFSWGQTSQTTCARRIAR
jgi:Protein of unknown function (DUF2281)